MTTVAELAAAVDDRWPGVIDTPLPTSTAAVEKITQDSRAVEAGSVFCAIRGSRSDGHAFVPNALEAGAVAIVVETPQNNQVAEFLVQDSRRATGLLSATLAGHPTDALQLVGVTGTNGKTSIVTLISHIAGESGVKAASMGTLTGSLTTAAAPDFQAAMGTHVANGCAVVAAEISSHALDQRRIAGSTVAVSVFSNLTQDHLDYHEDMDDYFEAKARLFSPEFSAHSVIDVSNIWGRRLADRVAAQRDIGAFPDGHQLIEVDGAALAEAAQLKQQSSTFEWRGLPVALPLGGAFSVTNAALAAEACRLLGISDVDIVRALEHAPQIPGRFESVDAGQPFAVIVDYSHTPASVAIAIESARELTEGRVILVFGAAGDRDPGKRPLMGEAATAADVLYVTSDNPRTEDPDVIIDEVVAGIERSVTKSELHRVADREAAIRAAVSGALPGDIVVIAGKGHEDYQIVGTTRRDFDDRVCARAALAELGWESAS